MMVKVREAKADDYDAWLKLWKAISIFTAPDWMRR